MESDVGWTIIAAVTMVVGLCGVVVPVLPGLMLMWVAALVYGFAVGWSSLGYAVMALFTVAVAISLVTSFVIPRRAAADGGASGWAQLGAIVGAVAGFFVIPVVGVIVGALVGLFVVEWGLKGDRREAWTATVATAKGFGLSALIDFGIGLVMLAAWAVWAASVLW